MPSNIAEKTNPSRTLELQSQAGRLRAMKNRASSVGKSARRKSGAFAGIGYSVSENGARSADTESSESLVGAKDSAYLKQSAIRSQNSFAYADNYLNSEINDRENGYGDEESSNENVGDPYADRLEELKEAARQQASQENDEGDEDSEQEDDESEEDGSKDKLVDQGEKAAKLLIWWMKNKKVQVTTETLVATFPENLGLPIFPLLFWWVVDNTIGNKKWPIEATLLLFITALIYFGLIALALAYIFLMIYLLVYPIDALKLLDSTVFSWLISAFTAN